ncbi:Similar to Dedicator of cytokinesis protein 5; acc. no. B2RY04 [Pyronema omphalodes CBS 100304]|uniref:Similar to Dedicator of cytokinesis protein 5 acc. no. B2RY04 n=1 Tax=Pyronema omphalodes (strain CBS 100304) TaxID=1076935 RepID=U4LU95_PYROM|nr:Similar to Dedicator of cytokinesis protein 5; acc. no. B2RY04 [Pyronema omphalodes CBS 100304]
MPWTPLPRIAFAVATYPYNPTTRDDLPLELGDELYIIEQTTSGQYYRGYLVAPPSLLAGLTSTKGSTLEARVFTGVFPAACVDVKEFLSTEVPLPDDFQVLSDEEDEAGFSDEDLAVAAARDMKRSRSRKKRDQLMSGGTTPKPRERPAAPVPMLKVGDETSSCEGEPLVDEIASCLREWHAANLHELLLNRRYPTLDEFSGLVNQLDLSRRQLLNNVLTRQELIRTREDTVWRLVKGNKLLGREIIVRDPVTGRILTGEDSSVEITQLQSVMSLLDEPPRNRGDDATRKFHLQLDHKSFTGNSSEPITIIYYLATKENKAVSESLEVDLDAEGNPLEVNGYAPRLQALFHDLSARDAEDLYLVARIYVNSSVPAYSPGGSGSIKDGVTGGTMTKNSANHSRVRSPSRDEKRLKGRVSVLFNSRPKTPGKENSDSRKHSSAKNSTRSLDSVSIPEEPDVPPVPTLKPKMVNFRRALGVGALDIGRFIKQEMGTEQTMHIFIPGRMTSGGDEEKKKKNSPESGDDWNRIIRDVIESRTKSPQDYQGYQGYRKQSTTTDTRLPHEKTNKADRLQIYMKPYSANDAHELIKSMPTVFHQVTAARKVGFTGAPTQPRSDIYITVDTPMITRNAIMVHPKIGAHGLPPFGHFNQLQLSMEVRKSNGEKILNAIFPSANSNGLTIWKSSVVSRDETWSQTVRLSLREEDVPDAHVFMTISGIPYPPAAMVWFPLWERGSFLKDGGHDLILQKYDEDTLSPMGNNTEGSGYITKPWSPDHEGWAQALMGATAASIKIKSYLVSTIFSQDDTLLRLLKWKELEQAQLVDCLKKVVFVPEIEIVRLLREVFDALFSVLVENTSKTEIEDLVFNAIVIVLGIVNDRRFNMEPIVDDYIDRLFDYPFAAPCLLRSFTRLLHDPSHIENSVRLRAAFKVGKHVFRFIVKAREKHVLKEATIGINGSTTFTKDLRGIFKLLEKLMNSSDPRLVGSQTLAVQHFHQWLPELFGVLTQEDILLVAIDFMDSCDNVKGKLILYKLVLIVNFSRSQMFSQPEDRRALTVNTVRWLEPHWGRTDQVTSQWRDQVRLCCSVLAEQVEELAEEVSEYIPKIVDSYLCILDSEKPKKERDTFSLLFPKTYPFPTKPLSKAPVFDEALVELSAILAAMSNVPTGLHLELPEDELAQFLVDTLRVHMSILRCEAFPQNWLSVHIYQHKSTMRTLENLAGILVDSFLPDPDDADRFNMDLWQAFFSTLLTLVGSDALALETFPEQKRRAVWKVAGDVREVGADLLRRTWEAIGWETSDEDKQRFSLEKMGGYQVSYVPGLVAPIVELCLSVHEGLRSVAVEVLQTMVVSEWTLNEDLSVIQAEMIDSLDRLFKSKRLTESITQKLFIADLIELFKPLSLIPQDPLSETVGQLLRTVDEFLDLLVAVHNTPLGEAYQIMDTLRLMDFLKDMRKEDMFIRYVHQLVSVQLASGNFVEAALSLRLHADLYTWDVNERVPALNDPNFPEQSAFERREQLFLEMIGYFEDGKSWENALETYRELAENYEHTVFEYGKLARCNRAMATLQESILEGARPEPRYYRVAYYGLGFPTGLRDRQFVIQAGPYEGHQMFADRMLMQHPAARLVDGVVDSIEGQFIHIVPVVPEINYASPAFRKQRVPATVRNFLAKKGIRAFSVVHKPKDVSHDEWTEKTVFVTATGFPAILKRSEVLDTVIVGVSPVERAIQEVLRRTQELIDLETKFSDYKSPDKAMDMSPFSIALTSAVDANKSVAHYRALLEEHETKEDLRDALRTVMADHVAVVKKALGTHGRLVPDALRPLQANCVKCFEATFRRELAEAHPTPSPAPGQWRQVAQKDIDAPVPMPQTPATISGSATPIALERPTVHKQRSMSIKSETATERSARGRLSTMIFGHNAPPMPPIPGGVATPQRSRSGSVSTSRSRKSTKSEKEGRDGRPKTPGKIERGVGSMRKRWSQMSLTVGSKKERESTAGSIRGRRGQFGMVEEEGIEA